MSRVGQEGLLNAFFSIGHIFKNSSFSNSHTSQNFLFLAIILFVNHSYFMVILSALFGSIWGCRILFNKSIATAEKCNILHYFHSKFWDLFELQAYCC